MFVFQIQVGRAVSGDRQAEGEATDSTDGRHRLGQCRETSLKNKPLLFCFVFDYTIRISFELKLFKQCMNFEIDSVSRKSSFLFL
jgi:hypothetical protein